MDRSKRTPPCGIRHLYAIRADSREVPRQLCAVRSHKQTSVDSQGALRRLAAVLVPARHRMRLGMARELWDRMASISFWSHSKYTVHGRSSHTTTERRAAKSVTCARCTL